MSLLLQPVKGATEDRCLLLAEALSSFARQAPKVLRASPHELKADKSVPFIACAAPSQL
jgi:hypothetical protein